MELFVGTSGFSYKEWQPAFYPPKMPADRFLAHYASELPCVEINGSFYRFPTKKLLAGWAEQVAGRDFSFVLKAPSKITHIGRLKPLDVVDAFIDSARTLGSHLGALLFQLPPNMKKDLERLDGFLEHVPSDVRVALEPRHPSWLEDDVLERLRARGVALCLAETEEAKADDELNAPFISTAPFGYLRLRREDYTEAELVAWATRLKAQAWEKVFVFFKHEAVRSVVCAKVLRAQFEGK